MVKIRTYYWKQRVIGAAGLKLRSIAQRPNGRHFRYGNAGDIFVADLVRAIYGVEPKRVVEQGNRLLLVGSIGHMLQPGDVACGIGVKDVPIPTAAQASITVRAVRGPISLERFAAAGHDVSDVRSQLDPGLLIGHVEDVADIEAERGRRIFIPHYRERDHYRGRMPNGIDLVDIDARPADIAREIKRAEVVYASSLHGVVFAHALGRPCVAVAPDEDEGLLKYEDYFLSLGLPWKQLPTGLDDALRTPAPTSPVDVTIGWDKFAFPTIDEARRLGLTSDGRG